MNINWFTWAFTLFRMILDFVDKAWGFFTFEIEFIGLELSVFEVLAGFGFTVIIIAIIIKALTPLL